MSLSASDRRGGVIGVVLRVLVGGALLTSVGAGVCALWDAPRAAVFLLCVAQTCGVCWIGLAHWHPERQWSRPEVVLAGAWALTFTLPSWIYAIDLGLLDVHEHPVEALGIVNLSLFCLILGAEGIRTAWAERAPEVSHPRVLLGDGSSIWLYFWLGIGALGMVLVFQGAGGPIEYLTNLNRQGEYNIGRTYIVWMALFLRYAAQVAVLRQWAAGRAASHASLLLLICAIGVTALLGARLFVAVALVELAVFYSLVRRPIPLRLALPVVAVVAFVLITLGGATKRYGNYQRANPGPDKSLAAYLVTDAPGEVASAYANNYADGTRLVAVARLTVPEYGDFERGQLLIRYALQPIPRSLRPTTTRDRAIRRALFPSGGNVHAMPLQASSYLQGGLPAVGISFALLGLMVALLDRALLRLRNVGFTKIVVLGATVVAIPSYLRSSEPGGFALATIELIGLGLVAWTADGGIRRLRRKVAYPPRRNLRAASSK